MRDSIIVGKILMGDELLGTFKLTKDGIEVKTEDENLKKYIARLNSITIPVLDGGEGNEGGVRFFYDTVIPTKITSKHLWLFKQEMSVKNYSLADIKFKE